MTRWRADRRNSRIRPVHAYDVEVAAAQSKYLERSPENTVGLLWSRGHGAPRGGSGRPQPGASSHFQNENPTEARNERGSTKCVPLNVDRKLYSAAWLVMFAKVNESRMRRCPSACSRLSVPTPTSSRLRGLTRSGL